MIKKFSKYLIKESLFTIVDLSYKIAEAGYDKEAIQSILSKAFRLDGDDGVIKMSKEFGYNVEPLGKGRYILK
jgi:hypothetical protein